MFVVRANLAPTLQVFVPRNALEDRGKTRNYHLRQHKEQGRGHGLGLVRAHPWAWAARFARRCDRHVQQPITIKPEVCLERGFPFPRLGLPSVEPCRASERPRIHEQPANEASAKQRGKETDPLLHL